MLSSEVQTGLGIYYGLCTLLIVGIAAYQSSASKSKTQPLVWGLVAGIFLIHALAFALGAQWTLAEGLKHNALTDLVFNPTGYFVTATIGFFLFLFFRKPLTDITVGFSMLAGILLLSGWLMTDPSFRSIISKPDNVPIVMLLFSVGFFTWLALRMAVINDERIAKGEPPLEKLGDEKVLTWPDLVYTELICMVIGTFALVIWAYYLKAPLEAPAATSKIPNPSKAPWYFLGLQEMLVYFDPWMAGVVLPSMIIVGLIAIPYIDYNVKGNGYFTFVERKFSIITFLYGFLVLWCALIVLGTFLRGPNWNFFSPFEPWDPHKSVPLNNVNLSTLFWLGLFGDSVETKSWLVRESPGIFLVFLYMVALPPLLAMTVMRPFFVRMGFFRFFLLVTLIQFMAALPLKMILRWTINLKYIVFIPEYFFNI
jgi:hypothetical protein